MDLSAIHCKCQDPGGELRLSERFDFLGTRGFACLYKAAVELPV